MSLRLKTLLTVLVTFATLVGGFAGVAVPVLLDSFEDLERDQVREDVDRVARALAATMDTLEAEALALVASPNTVAKGVDLVVRLPDDQRAARGTAGGASRDLVTAVASAKPLQDLRADGARVVGWLRGPALGHAAQDLRDGASLPSVLMVAARAVEPEPSGAPSVTVVGRWLDAAELDRVTALTRLDVSARAVTDPDLPPEVRDRLAVPDGRPIVVDGADGTPVGWAALPGLDGTAAFALRVHAPRATYAEGQEAVLYTIGALAGAGVVMLLVMLLALERLVIARVIGLSAAVAGVTDSGDLSTRVAPGGRDELSALGESMNRMLEGLERSDQRLRMWNESLEAKVLERTGQLHAATQRLKEDFEERKRLEEELQVVQKLESLGILAGGIAHDFNNFLTGILGNVSLAKVLLGDGHPVSERLDRAERAAERARDLTKQLLTFAKGGAPIRTTASLPELLEDTASFATSGSNVRTQFNLPLGLWGVAVDTGQISQVVSNLLINAQDAMPGGGTIQIEATNTMVAADDPLPPTAGAYVKVTIADEGEGIAEEHLRKVFDPYFTTKDHGTGLGLATSWSIVKQHEGHISVESVLGQGTTFHLWLPARVDRDVSAVAVPPDGLVRGRGRILVMDDEALVRDLANEMLTTLGYRADTAPDGHTALEMWRLARAASDPYDAVILDLTIPGGMGGVELIGHLKAEDPGVVAIVSSGYANAPIMAQHEAHGFTGVMAKPYRVGELGHLLADILGS